MGAHLVGDTAASQMSGRVRSALVAVEIAFATTAVGVALVLVTQLSTLACDRHGH